MSARVVAFLGSSSTAAHGLYDWIGEVAGRPENASWSFRRFASGGDLSYNGLRRCDEISASRPDAIVILLGGNDVCRHRRRGPTFSGIAGAQGPTR